MQRKTLPINLTRTDWNGPSREYVSLTKDTLWHIGNGGALCKSGAYAYTKFGCTEQVPDDLRGSVADSRPLSVFIGICPLFYTLSIEQQYVPLFHESIHALGWSIALMQDWPRAACNNQSCVGSYMRAAFGTGALYKGTRSTQLARDHWGCQDIEGIEFKGSHLSGRVYYGETMTSFYDSHAPYIMDSALVFSILAESGWYELSSSGERNILGWDQGCDMYKMDCVAWAKASKDDRFYCFNITENCDTFTYNKKIAKPPIPTHPYVGGYKDAEFCPFTKNYQFSDYKTRRPLPPQFSVWNTEVAAFWSTKTFWEMATTILFN